MIIKSFVQRGRVTKAQQHAIDTYASEYLIDPKNISWDNAILEIGFGDGMALFTAAEQDPTTSFVGIEVHKSGIGKILDEIHKANLKNLKIIYGDAVVILNEHIPDASLKGVRIFFNDPWPKKRHHKRRLIQSEFVEILASKLAANAYLHLATDWQPYAEQMLEILSQNNHFTNKFPIDKFVPQQEVSKLRITTKFERRGKRLGHDSWDLFFAKSS